MIGGDRMTSRHHGYAGRYAQYLEPFVRSPNQRLVLVEVGILRGTGLAVWSELFPAGRIIGLDIDLSHFHEYETHLRHKGAFRAGNVTVSQFDQFAENSGLLEGLLMGAKIDVMIDDGVHSEASILTTLRSAIPHLAESFVYFIEDNAEIGAKIRSLYPGIHMECAGELTILTGPASLIR